MLFNDEAFPKHEDEEDDEGGIVSSQQLQSLDDYFDLSKQASLLGSQNPSGKQENILLNGGLLGLRRRLSRTMNLDDGDNNNNNAMGTADGDDWVIDFSALWWFCRCGERDQIALWLVLFATWSSESYIPAAASSLASDIGFDAGAAASSSSQFYYPGVLFENYLFAWHGVIPHARHFLPKLRQTWINDTTTTADSPAAWSSSSSSMVEHHNWKANAPLDSAAMFDGGGSDGFLNSTYGAPLTYPLELPHVLLLPLDPFALPSQKPNPYVSAWTRTARRGRTNFTFGIVKKAQPEKKALLTHNKNTYDACYNFGCWPFLIREDPDAYLQRHTKNAKAIEKKPTNNDTK